MKLLVLSLTIILFLSCQKTTISKDHKGENSPDSTPVIFESELISVKGRLEHGISFTSDGRELAFGILDPSNYNGEIYYSKKSTDKWSEPIVFEPLKGQSTYLPYFTPDGKSMLYAQSKVDSVNYITDIWLLNKDKDTWGQPKKVDSPISTMTRESTACMTLDNTIYFSSNRDGNGLADLYYSRFNNGAHSNIQLIDAINTEGDEESIFVAPDEGYIIFSRYASNDKGPDLLISHRNNNGQWTHPRLLGAAINTAQWERRPFVSKDNRFLYFTRMKMNETGIEESDIYWVNTHKVFAPFVFNPFTSQTIPLGQESKMVLPLNYFKDTDQENLEIHLIANNFNWVRYDEITRTLIMNPIEEGEFELAFTAIDNFANETTDQIKIIVEN